MLIDPQRYDMRKAVADRILADPNSTALAREGALMLAECVAELKRDAEMWRAVLTQVEECRAIQTDGVAQTLADHARKELGSVAGSKKRVPDRT